MNNLYESSNNIIALERPHKHERLHACCVNLKTTRKHYKASLLKRAFYALNPIPARLDQQLTDRLKFTALIGGGLIAFTALLIMGV